MDTSARVHSINLKPMLFKACDPLKRTKKERTNDTLCTEASEFTREDRGHTDQQLSALP